MKKKVKIRPWIHIYAFALVWVLWAAFLPMLRLYHFAGVIVASLAVAIIVRLIFRGKTIEVDIPEQAPEPFSSGDPEVDALVREGERALEEMGRLRRGIRDKTVEHKVEEIIEISGKIIQNVMEDPTHFQGVRRFLRYYLPTTIKLLHAYDRLDSQGVSGKNISGTMGKIEDTLDTMIVAYKKQLDALFAHKALDIETDIEVMEGILKKEGLKD